MKAIANRSLTSYVGTYLQLCSLFKIRPNDIVPKIIRSCPFIFRDFYLIALCTSLSLYNIQQNSGFFLHSSGYFTRLPSTPCNSIPLHTTQQSDELDIVTTVDADCPSIRTTIRRTLHRSLRHKSSKIDNNIRSKREVEILYNNLLVSKKTMYDKNTTSVVNLS